MKARSSVLLLTRGWSRGSSCGSGYAGCRRGCARGSGLGNELERCGVDAVTETSGCWTVVENVAQMRTTTGAAVFVAHHASRAVGALANVGGVIRIIERRPASARVELGAGGKQRQTAHDTLVGAFSLAVPVPASEWALSARLETDTALLIRQLLGCLVALRFRVRSQVVARLGLAAICAGIGTAVVLVAGRVAM